MDWKELVRGADLATLRRNWDEQQPLKGTRQERDFHPVVKLFNPIGVGCWLLTEVDQDGLAFGLCDLGVPELGYVDLQEIADAKLAGSRARIEQDIQFTAAKPLSEYAEEARIMGYIRA